MPEEAAESVAVPSPVAPSSGPKITWKQIILNEQENLRSACLSKNFGKAQLR